MKPFLLLLFIAFFFLCYLETISAYCCDVCPMYKCTPSCNIFGCNCKCFVCVGEFDQCNKEERGREYAREQMAKFGFFGKLGMAQFPSVFHGRRKRDIDIGNLNETIAQAKDLFEAADKSNDGFISKEEAIEFLIAKSNETGLDFTLTAEQLNKNSEWFKSVDLNGNGKIEPFEVDLDLAFEDNQLTRDEAIAFFAIEPKLMEELKKDDAWFKHADSDGDGKIEMEELKKIDVNKEKKEI